MAALAQPHPMEAVVRDMVRGIALPPGVTFRRLCFDYDHSGEPAVYVVFGVSKRIPLTPKRAKELAELTRAVQRPIWEIPSGPVPYVSLEDAR